MRSRAPLALIELVVMLLVLAIAAALCLQAFVWADSASAWNHRRTDAMMYAQNAAQMLKYCGGDFTKAAQLHGGHWNGQQWTLEKDGFALCVEPIPSQSAYLGMAQVKAAWEETVLATISVCWQEDGHEK